MNDSQAISCRKARLALEDCRHALARLWEEPVGQDWRILWVATMTLLKTIDYVLIKDTENGPSELQVSKDDVRKERGEKDNYPQEHKIFWEFIDSERTNIVHSYEFNAGQGVIVFVGSDKPNQLNYIMRSGPYSDRDHRDLVKESIAWWDNQIDEIETRAFALMLEKNQ